MGPANARVRVKSAVSLAIAALAVCVSGACTSRPLQTQDPVQRFGGLRLERSTCYGTCPAYVVTLDAKGQVTFQGGRFVRATSGASVLGPGGIRAVIDVLDVAQFQELRTQYQTEADGCEVVATDMETVTLTVTLDGHTKAIRHYLGCMTLPKPPTKHGSRSLTPDPAPEWRPPEPPARLGCSWPPALVRLERRVDEILGTERWSGSKGGWQPRECEG